MTPVVVIDALKERFPAISGPRSMMIFAMPHKTVKTLLSNWLTLVMWCWWSVSPNSSNSNRRVNLSERMGHTSLLN